MPSICLHYDGMVEKFLGHNLIFVSVFVSITGQGFTIFLNYVFILFSLFNVVGVVSRIFLLTPFVFFWKQEVDRYDDLNKRLQDMGFTGVYKVWAFLSCTL